VFRTITVEGNDLGPRYFAGWFTITLARPSSKVKFRVRFRVLKNESEKWKTSYGTVAEKQT